jgi:hypothetical protein
MGVGVRVGGRTGAGDARPSDVPAAGCAAPDSCTSSNGSMLLASVSTERSAPCGARRTLEVLARMGGLAGRVTRPRFPR